MLVDICLAGKINAEDMADIIRKNFQISVLYLTDYSEDIRSHKNQLGEPSSYILLHFQPICRKGLAYGRGNDSL